MLEISSQNNNHNTGRRRKILSLKLICDNVKQNFQANDALLANKRSLRAKGLSLLSLALRPCLLGELVARKRGEGSRKKRVLPFGGRRSLGLVGVGAVLCLGLSGAFGTERASAASLTLSVPSTALSLEIKPEDGVKQSAASTITVKTDALAGYTLSVKSNNESNALINGEAQLASIEGSLSLSQYQMPGNENTWGFKPSKLKGAANENFLAGSVKNKDVELEKTNTKNTKENSYEIVLGAKVSEGTAVGEYKSTFVFAATANPVPYSFTYDVRDGTGGPEPKVQTGTVTGDTVKLDTAVPTPPSSFAFAGWCDSEPTRTAGRDQCSGQVYQAGGDYTLTDNKNEVTFYAMYNELLLTELITAESAGTMTFKAGEGIEMVMVADGRTNSTPYADGLTYGNWRPHYAFQDTPVANLPASGQKLVVTVVPQANYKLGSWTKEGDTWTANGVLGSYETMQNLTAAECTTAGKEGMNVTDSRNNISYTVGQFGDKCWMFSNLRLAPSTELNTETSDVNDSFTLPSQQDSDAWVSGSQNYFSKKNMKVCKGPAGYNEESWYLSSGVGETGMPCDRGTSGVTEYYYNWYAAIANDAEGDVFTDITSATEMLDNQARGSICPSGWGLINENDNGEITSLIAAWNADKTNNPGRLVMSGLFWSGGQYKFGLYGRWWSSSRGDNAGSYFLDLSSGGAYRGYVYKVDANSVRCVLR